MEADKMFGEMSVEKAAAGKDGLPRPCWRVRVAMRGAGLLHLLSRIEPRVTYSDVNGGVSRVEIDIINDTPFGDTLGFIDWREVGAVSWRMLSVPETEGAGIKYPSVREPKVSALSVLSFVSAHPGLSERRYRIEGAQKIGGSGVAVKNKLAEAVENGWLSVRSEDGTNFYDVTEAGHKALAESAF